MWHESEEGLDEESEAIWLLPSMIDVTRDDESEPVGDLMDTQPGLNADMIVPRVDASFFRCRRIAHWLQAIESAEEPSLVSLSMPDGPSVEFAVNGGCIVSMPYVDGLFFMDEEYLNEVGEGARASDASVETMFVRLFERATLFELDAIDEFDVDEIAIAPSTLCVRMFEEDATNPVWETFEQLHAHADRWWMWRRMGSDFHLARHAEDTTLASARHVLEGVKSLLGSLERDERMGNAVISGKDESWHLCWDDDWFFLERNVFVGRVLYSFDRVMKIA